MPRPSKTTPFTLRLTEKERAELKRRAGRKPLGTYIRGYLFTHPASNPKPSPKDIATVLARLGKSDIANNLRVLSQAARSGSLPLSPETTAKLDKASKDITAIKSMLMKALGISEH